MGERAIVLLGSLYDYENDCTIAPTFLRDLKCFGALPSDHLNAVLEGIKQADSCDAVESVVNARFETNTADSVLRLLEFFSTAGTEGFIGWLTALRASSDVVRKGFPDDDWGNFLEKFKIIQGFIPVRCIANRVKRENLQTITGNLFQGIDIICDVRPVFNVTRETVEEFIPVTTLRISYLTQAEETEVLEIILSEEHIDELAEKIKIAKKKWDVLQKNFSRKKTAVE